MQQNLSKDLTKTCDRCGKKYKINNDDKRVIVGELPSRVSVKEFGAKQPRAYILCPNCTRFVINFIEYKK